MLSVLTFGIKPWFRFARRLLPPGSAECSFPLRPGERLVSAALCASRPRLVAADYPRRGRGVAATRLRGPSASRPQLVAAEYVARGSLLATIRLMTLYYLGGARALRLSTPRGPVPNRRAASADPDEASCAKTASAQAPSQAKEYDVEGMTTSPVVAFLVARYLRGPSSRRDEVHSKMALAALASFSLELDDATPERHDRVRRPLGRAVPPVALRRLVLADGPRDV